MSNAKKEIMRQEISQNISPLTKYLINIGLNLNVFYYDMLSDFSVSIWIPFLSDLIQYIHILYYPFKENVSFDLLTLFIYL